MTGGDGARVWAAALQALTLFAADPAGLGGIALRAAAGPVRDRFLALLTQALPHDMALRRVPLNVADDRLIGGLDLAATLRAGHPVAQTGLLAEADGGVAILAMAERVEPGTAAHLRAALDTGLVHVQRDGLSQVRSARFGLVALDEGADAEETIPASLRDRMAFLIDLTQVAIGDCAAADARAAFASVAPADDAVADAVAVLAAAASALGVDSPRAPLFALRAATLAARLDGRAQRAPEDLALAAALVLAPRATRLPAPADSAEAPPEPPPPDDAPDERPEAATLPDTPLEDLVLEAALAALPPHLLAQLADHRSARGAARTPGRAGQTRFSVRHGRPVGARRGDPRGGARLHLLETLKAAAPWQALRRQTDGDRFQVRRDDFRLRRYRRRIGTTTIFAVDASGSAAMQRLGEAKGAVELLLADCYVRRDQVALVAFRGQAAEILLPPTGSLLRARRCLAGLPGGGPTPLAAGIDAARALADAVRRTGRTPVITLLTDARANIARDGTGGRPRAEAEAVESAQALRGSGVATLLVDTSPRPNPFARRLAEAMDARYLPLPYADAAAVSRAVREVG